MIASEAEHFSLQGVDQALVVLEAARDALNPGLEWIGIVLTMADMRLVHARETLGQLQERYPGKVFETSSGARCATPSRPSAAARSSTTRPTSARTTSGSRTSSWRASRRRRRPARLRADPPRRRRPR